MKMSESPGDTPAESRSSSLTAAAPTATRSEPPGHADAAAEASGPRSGGHGAIWWCWYLIVWAGTLALLAVAAARIFYHDGVYFLTWINAFTRYVYVPAYVGLAWSIWQRRVVLALLSGLIVACHLVWLSPDFLRDRRYALSSGAEAAALAPPVRIFFANVLQSNREFDTMFDEVAAADPDIVVFAEWGWAWDQAFERSEVSRRFPYGESLQRPNYGNVNIFSKIPLKSETSRYVDGRLVRTIDIEVGSETLRLIGLHAARPLRPDQRDYVSYWTQMLELLAAEKGPLVVVGDFNATEHSLVYKKLEALGLRSAHEACGRGYATTWPNDLIGVSLIRIDQAFLSPEVECERIAEGAGQGSDHRPLVVDLRVQGRSPPPIPKRPGES